jgi:hypothetical protein
MEPEFLQIPSKIPLLKNAVKYFSAACVIYLPGMSYFLFAWNVFQKSNQFSLCFVYEVFMDVLRWCFVLIWDNCSFL